MHNYVALADENEWLRDLDVEIVNARLEERRRAHVRLMDSGEFWKLSKVWAGVWSRSIHTAYAKSV